MKQANIQYCVQCGSALEIKECYGQTRPTCPQCNWVYFPDPKVATGVLVESEEGVLLVRRINEPEKGCWSFPAGFMDAGEDPAEAAVRECLEETGLKVKIVGLIDVVAGREHEHGADLIIIYKAEILSGSVCAGDDADRAGFFPRNALPPLAFNATRQVLGLLPTSSK